MEIDKKGVVLMSAPAPPYYYKKSSDTYHWETGCSKNYYSPTDPDWIVTESQPSGREQCNECKAK
jgi:hypothetical protein